MNSAISLVFLFILLPAIVTVIFFITSDSFGSDFGIFGLVIATIDFTIFSFFPIWFSSLNRLIFQML